MRKKKLLATLLAIACVASMSVSAYAAPTQPEGIGDELWGAVSDDENLTTDDGTVNVDIETEVQKPAMAVVIPKSVKVFVNPYRSEVVSDAGDPDDTSDDVLSIDTVVSPQMTVKNASTCAIKIGVTGALVTYKYVESATDLGTKITPVDAEDETGVIFSGLDKVIGNVDKSALYLSGGNYYLKENGASNVYRQVTVKATAAVDTDTKKSPAKYDVSGYVATQNIKAATAAVKEDTEKSNSIFMYVEGKKASDEYKTAFTKVAAGIDAKGVVNYGGMLSLDSKAVATGDVLYLGSPTGDTPEVGNIRITGSAATNPTVDWTTAQETENFETPFAFSIKPVANAAENPIITGITGSAGVEVTTKYAAGTFKYAVTVESTATAGKINLTVANGETIILGSDAEAGAALSAKPTISGTALTLKGKADGTDKAKTTFTFNVKSKHGKINTYTIEVTLKKMS